MQPHILIFIRSLIQSEGKDCSFNLRKITYCFENMRAFLIKEQIYSSVLFYEINCPNKRLKLIYILISHLIRSLLYEFVSLTLLPGLNIFHLLDIWKFQYFKTPSIRLSVTSDHICTLKANTEGIFFKWFVKHHQ